MDYSYELICVFDFLGETETIKNLFQQPPLLQSGGPRTTPSGYPGGPVVPSGQLSPQHHNQHHYQLRSSQQMQTYQYHHHHPMHQQQPQPHLIGYATTGRMSTHQLYQQQKQPVSFTRAMEISDGLMVGGGPAENVVSDGSGNMIPRTSAVTSTTVAAPPTSTGNSGRPSTGDGPKPAGNAAASSDSKGDGGAAYDVNNSYEISV